MGTLKTRSAEETIEDIISSAKNDPDTWTEIGGVGHPAISMEAFDEILQQAVADRGWVVSRVQRGSEAVLRIDKKIPESVEKMAEEAIEAAKTYERRRMFVTLASVTDTELNCFTKMVTEKAQALGWSTFRTVRFAEPVLCIDKE